MRARNDNFFPPSQFPFLFFDFLIFDFWVADFEFAPTFNSFEMYMKQIVHAGLFSF